MKISSSITLLSLILVCTSLSACNSTNSPFSYFNKSKANSADQSVATSSDSQGASSNKEKVVIQKIDNNPGISSTTVERLAKQNQCEPKEIVNLLTPKGPIEIYRTTCEDGKIFMARCELRQCKAMPTAE